MAKRKQLQMNILYITAEGFDTPNPNNQMAMTMIRGFIEHGNSVHLIQSHRKGVYPDIPESLRDLPGFSCDTIKRKCIDKTKFVRRYLNDFRYAFQAMRYWRKVRNADVIYLQSNPTIIYPMLLLKMFKRLPIVYSIYDVFPGHAYDIGVIKSRLIYNILRIMQKPCYKLADKITVLSEDMKDKVVKQGADPDKVKIVPAWFDVRTAKEIPAEENRFMKKYNLPKDKFYVQFAGTLGYVFNYNTVLELAKRLKNESDIEIQIIGDGNIKELFVTAAKKEGLDNIRFYPLQPIELVPDVYSACDVCLIPLKKGVIGNGVPSKIAILMACRRVVISSVESDSDYAKMFERYDMGISIDIDDCDGLAKAVLDLKTSSEKRERMANNAYDFGKAHFSSDKSILKFLNVLEEAAGVKRS